MDLVILSDIHANTGALEQVVRYARKQWPEARFCFLGDAIGYGPQPVGVLEQMKQLDDEGLIFRGGPDGLPAIIPGNHEECWLWCAGQRAVMELPREVSSLTPSQRYDRITTLVTSGLGGKFGQVHDDGYSMQDVGLKAMLLNMLRLDASASPAVGWYRDLMAKQIVNHKVKPLVYENVGPGAWRLVLVHGTMDGTLSEYLWPCHSTDDEYLRRYAEIHRDGRRREIWLHGHTHVPLYCRARPSCEPDSIYEAELRSEAADFLIVNPGSVGLPRDRDVRVSLAVLRLDEQECGTRFVRLAAEDDADAARARENYLTELEAEWYPPKLQEWARKATAPDDLNQGRCQRMLRTRAGPFFI